MGMQAYREVLAAPTVRRTLLLGLLIRIPMWASAIVLTLHVVGHLGGSYTDAGLVVAVATVTAAISGPWRGRLLDRRGLRATVLPSLIVLSICWSVAPFLSYWWLVGIAAVAGLFVVPTFSIIRQVVIGAVQEHRRTTALALDSVAVEISFMAGPALGVWLATSVDTSIALLCCEFASVLGGLALWILDPALPAAENETASIGGPVAAVARRRRPWDALARWMTPTVLAVLAASMTATVVLTGTDVSVVAALREQGHPGSIGWILAIWGAGSAIGGLAYGAWGRTISPFVLVGALGLTTAAVSVAPDRGWISGLLFVAGLCCAPTITATIDLLSRVVPPRVRGEAMGWHGSAMTIGSAVGAPTVGFVLDRAGWHGGFVVAGVFGVLIGVAGWSISAVRRTRATQSAASADEPHPGRPDSARDAQILQAGVPPGN